jgi:hypothetical protein
VKTAREEVNQRTQNCCFFLKPHKVSDFPFGKSENDVRAMPGGGALSTAIAGIGDMSEHCEHRL